MTDNRTTLLPCPFCGGEAELKLYQNGDWQIICYHADGCIMRESDLSDCYWESVQTLARQWNTRADYHGYEQAAIEAWESIKAWNTRAELGSGTLTAEQVRKAIFAGSVYASYDGAQYYASGIEQAIADELNAMLGSDNEYEAKMDALLCRLTNGKWSKTRAYDLDFMVSCVDEEYETLYAKELAELGSGTCSIVKTWSDSDYVDDWRYRCSECGCNIPVNERDPETGDVINAANYCPNCGRKVVSA